MLEADLQLMHNEMMFQAYLVDDIGQGKCFGYFAGLVLLLDQILEDNGEKFMRVHKGSVFVEHAYPVSIAVIDNGDIGLNFLEEFNKFSDVLRHWFRIDASETRVDAAVIATEH